MKQFYQSNGKGRGRSKKEKQNLLSHYHAFFLGDN
jgi:hypothetical protein